MNLKEGSYLQNGKYRIESVLGQGGFGITYLAMQSGLNRKVAIKEFFMKEYCNRDEGTSHVSVPSLGSKSLVEKFKTKFVKEAQTIASMDHHNIIKIYDVFEENGTAYYVMEYLDCGTLSASIPAGGMPEVVATRYIRQVADALRYMHEEKHTTHLDVKPSNILLKSNGDAVLIDFGIAIHYDENSDGVTSTYIVGVSKGYAPLEQNNEGGLLVFSPSTDIYSLGATFYKLLSGVTPPSASEVNEMGLPPLPPHVSKPARFAIARAMRPFRSERYQSVAEFISSLSLKPQKPRRKVWPWILVSLVVACVGTALVFLGAKESNGGDDSWPVSETSDALTYDMLGPFEYHNEVAYVDLGLPSGLKWAALNLGAAYPEDNGDVYIWGSVIPADYTDSSSITTSLKDISGNSRYDAARAQLGGGWRMPTEKEVNELIDNCYWDKCYLYDIYGWLVTGRNGNSMFLPFMDEFKSEGENIGVFWTSNISPSDPKQACIFYINEHGAGTEIFDCEYFLNIRPVLD